MFGVQENKIMYMVLNWLFLGTSYYHSGNIIFMFYL